MRERVRAFQPARARGRPHPSPPPARSRRCPRLRGLALTHYQVNDVPDAVLDVRHLPLRAAAVVQSTSGCSMTVLLPRGLHVLTLGHDDLDALHQPGVADDLRVLKLPQASSMDLATLDRLPLAKLRRVHVSSWNLTPALAARLGQRCARADLLFEHAVEADVEYDVALL